MNRWTQKVSLLPLVCLARFAASAIDRSSLAGGPAATAIKSKSTGATTATTAADTFTRVRAHPTTRFQREEKTRLAKLSASASASPTVAAVGSTDSTLAACAAGETTALSAVGSSRRSVASLGSGVSSAAISGGNGVASHDDHVHFSNEHSVARACADTDGTGTGMTGSYGVIFYEQCRISGARKDPE